MIVVFGSVNVDVLVPVPRLPEEMAFPAIELNGTPLWGFTYRVITEWLGLHADRPSMEPPGFEAARLVLEFLLAEGLVLRQGWAEQAPAGQKIALVAGAIPVKDVLDHFSISRGRFPGVNSIEVRKDHVRVVGLGLEEYVIRTESGGDKSQSGYKAPAESI